MILFIQKAISDAHCQKRKKNLILHFSVFIFLLAVQHFFMAKGAISQTLPCIMNSSHLFGGYHHSLARNFCTPSPQPCKDCMHCKYEDHSQMSYDVLLHLHL